MLQEEENKRIRDDKIIDWVSGNLFYSFLIVVLVILLILVSVFGITALIYQDKTILNPNEIGDAIGGMTAPIIGLFSAFLVYVAFRAQIKANEELQEFNKKQNSYNDLNIYLELEKSLLSELERLSYNTYNYISNSNKWETDEITGWNALKNINNRFLKNAILNEYSIQNLLKNKILSRSNIIDFIQNAYLVYIKLESLIDYFKSCNFDENLKALLVKNIKAKFELNEIENIKSYDPIKIENRYSDIKLGLEKLLPKIKNVQSKIENL